MPSTDNFQSLIDSKNASASVRPENHSGIMINMVPHIVEHKHAGYDELVVAIPCLDLLSKKFRISNQLLIMINLTQLRRTYVSTGSERSRKEPKLTHSITLRKRPATDGDMNRQNAIEELSE